MADDRTPRLAPLGEDDWDERLSTILAGLDPVLNVHRMLAHHPELVEAWWPLRGHIALGGSLEPRHREIVILRFAHRVGSGYEWHQHVIRGGRAGLGADEIEAIRNEPAGSWLDAEATLIAATDELVDLRTVTDPTWDALRRSFSVEQILDIIMTVGVYGIVAMVIAATGVELEDPADQS